MLETAHLQSIFRAALHAADAYELTIGQVSLNGSCLTAAAGGERHSLDLDSYSRVIVLGAGKASARMALALEEILGGRISGGLISVKYGHGQPLKRIEVVEAGHPVPDAKGEEAARRIAQLAAGADAKTLILNVVSGGGSALLPLPADGLTLAEKQEMTGLLLASGADIHEMNCVRKHLSRLKGGRLLRLMAPAPSLNLILSDVAGDELGTIASGLTATDATTFADALAVIGKYGLRGKAPAPALKILEDGAAGLVEETLKPGDPAALLATNVILGSNRTAVIAACEHARGLGYATVALTSSMAGEAREVAKVLYGIARDVRDGGLLVKPPACVVAGGETAVTLKGSGKGGRNQELALAFLAELARDEHKGQGIHLLSASTDGTDGPTDAAGAFASAGMLALADAAGLSIAAGLANNDSYRFFSAIGQLFKTGPTMTNVCDLQLMLIS
ncbi:MAG: glycerate kinase [Rhodomicrobium sp.]